MSTAQVCSEMYRCFRLKYTYCRLCMSSFAMIESWPGALFLSTLMLLVYYKRRKSPLCELALNVYKQGCLVVICCMILLQLIVQSLFLTYMKGLFLDVLQHPFYSPDLFPCAFRLSPLFSLGKQRRSCGRSCLRKDNPHSWSWI